MTGSMWWRSVIFSGLIFGGILALVPHVLWLVGFLFGKMARTHVPYAPFGWTSVAMLLIVWSLLFYGRFYGIWQIDVHEERFTSQKLPSSFRGYRIVHISDLHVDTYNDKPEALMRVVDKINEQAPDLILFTGDMATGSLESVFLHEKALSLLKARDGVVSVLGNHDFFIYDRQYSSHRERCAAADTLTRFEKEKLGWNVLRNQHIQIKRNNESICIAGVDNIYGSQGFHTIQKGDLRMALNGTDGLFTILLSHDPSHWKAEVLPQSSVQITLSGHTHASQLRLFGWSLANLMFNECDGRYEQDGRMLYVNAGIGCTAPFRIGCPSEITVITLD